MSDLISRQDAIDAVERAKTARTEDGEIFCAKINAQMNIQLLPSAEPEVVRCKDCKHWNITSDGFGECEITDRQFFSIEYCSFGERKEE